MDPHAEYSSLRESILEHALLGALGKELWRRGHFDMEILQAEVDDSGYDIVLEAALITRHIQVKAKIEGGNTASFAISERLTQKPSGCLIVIYVNRDSLETVGYRFYGGVPGDPFPDISTAKFAKHTKGNALGEKTARKRHRLLRESQCEKVADIKVLLDRLIG